MEFLCEEIASLMFFLQSSSVLIRVGNSIRLYDGSIKMTKNILVLEGNMKMGTEHHPAHTINLKFWDIGHRV